MILFENVPVREPPKIRPELFLVPDDVFYALDTNEVQATYNTMKELDIAHLPYQHIIIGVGGDVVMRMKINVLNQGGRHLLPTDTDEVFEEIKSVMIRLPNGPPSEYELAGRNTVFKPGTPLGDIFESAARHMSSSYPTGFEYRFFYAPHPSDGHINCYKVQFKSPRTNGAFLDIANNFAGNTYKNKLNEEQRHVIDVSLKVHMDAAATSIARILIVLLATKNAIKTRTKDKLLALGIGKRRKGNNKPLYTTTITLPKLSPKSDNLTGRTVSPHLRRGHVRNQAWGPKRQFHRSVWIEPVFVNADENFVSTRVAYNTSLTSMEANPS